MNTCTVQFCVYNICTFFSLVMSVPCTFLSFVMSVSVIFLYNKLVCALTCMFTVHVHTKPVCSTAVHKTSLQYRCTQNQFTVQVYTKSVYSIGVLKPVNLTALHKPVYSTCIHKTRLEYTF